MDTPTRTRIPRLLFVLFVILTLLLSSSPAFAKMKQESSDPSDLGEGGGGGGGGLGGLASSLGNAIVEVGTVVVQAVSDAISYIVDQVKRLKNEVEALVRTVKDGIDGIVAGFRKAVGDPVTILKGNVAMARADASAALTAARSAHSSFEAFPPAPDTPEWNGWNSARADMRRGAEQVGSLAAEVTDRISVDVESGLARVEGQAEAFIVEPIALANGALLSPLSDMGIILSSFLENPSALINPVSATEATLDAVNRIMQQEFDRLAATLELGRKQSLEALKPIEDVTLAKGLSDVAWAQSIVARMQSLAQAPTAANQSALQSALQSPPPPGVPGTGPARQKYRRAVTAEARVFRGAVPSATVGRFQSARGLARGTKERINQPLRIPPGAAQRGQAELDRLFAGRTPEETAALKTAVLQEVRKRYGGSQWAMNQAKTLLDAEAGRRAGRPVVPVQKFQQQQLQPQPRLPGAPGPIRRLPPSGFPR